MRSLPSFLFTSTVVLAGALFLAQPAHAITVTSGTVSNTVIPFETGGLPNGVTIQFTLDAPADVLIAIHEVVNQTDALSATNLVATLPANGLGSGANSVFWNGLWLINQDFGRHDGFFEFVISATSASATTAYLVAPLVRITSVDVHNLIAAPSLDANGQPSFPYRIQYSLAKDALVTVTIKDSTGTVVRTLFTNQPQLGETTAAALAFGWDGLNDNGSPVPLGLYTVAVDARDPATGDRAITRTRTAPIGSLANSNVDPKTFFETSTFAFPNPVRNGSVTIQTQAARPGASMTLKIYSIAGDLVRDVSLGSVPTGNVATFVWNLTNTGGSKVGRGLYYYVMRESDSGGTLQVTKKLAVIQ